MCYAMPDNDFKTFSKLVDTKEERDTLKRMRQYGMAKQGTESFAKVQRIAPVISPED